MTPAQINVLLEAIRDFIKAQLEVVELLCVQFDVDPNITALEWVNKSEEIRTMHKANPIAKVFEPHGYGLVFTNESINIDYDYCKNGRLGGFDAWRLYSYCQNKSKEIWLQEHLEFKAALNELEKKGFIEREENLYFLVPT